MKKDFEIYERYYRDLKKEVFQIKLFFPKSWMSLKTKMFQKSIPKLVFPDSLFVTTTQYI